MNLPDGVLGAGWLWLGALVVLPLWLFAMWNRPWRALADNTRLHLFLGSCVGWMMLWLLKAGVAPGLNAHLLGATWFTLLFGWRLAVLGLSVVLLGATLAGTSGTTTFALNACAMVIAPVLAAQGAHRFIERYLPRHLFVFLFASGFFNAALSMVVSVTFASALLASSGLYTWDRLASEFLPFALLLAFPEAFVTGAGLSYFVVYHPAWVASYREEAYLGR
ncbi:MAG: energy-coupling factor ABC transporter permease [Pseudomonadota bacterium]|nr:MAG: energy-coupling factor ABC transporter permease [Pseudomonadota bacterium]